MEMATYKAGARERCVHCTAQRPFWRADPHVDPTLVHCPMPLCQTAVPRLTDVEEGSPWERLRTCAGCGYSFCSYCKRTWCVAAPLRCARGVLLLKSMPEHRHGPVSQCPISAMKGLLMEYLAHPEDGLERKKMEGRFGRAMLQKLVAEFQEERAFQEWLERWTGTACPGCDLRVEKASGCNHVRTLLCFTVPGVGQPARHCDWDADCMFSVADDMREMRVALLLQVRGPAGPEAAVQTLLDARTAMLFEAVRRGEHRRRVAACRGVRGHIRMTPVHYALAGLEWEIGHGHWCVPGMEKYCAIGGGRRERVLRTQMHPALAPPARLTPDGSRSIRRHPQTL